MKTIIFFILILTLVNLNKAALPFIGKIVFTYFKRIDSVKSDVETFEVLPTDTCKPFGQGLYLRVRDWKRTRLNDVPMTELDFSVYTIPTCIGEEMSPTHIVRSFVAKCNSSNYVSITEGKLMTCYHIDFSPEEYSKLLGYIDGTCRNDMINGQIANDNTSCWKISSSTSFVPTYHETSTDLLWGVNYENSPTCDNEVSTSIESIKCWQPGCLKGSNNPFNECEDSNSSKFLLINLIFTLAMFLFMF